MGDLPKVSVSRQVRYASQYLVRQMLWNDAATLSGYRGAAVAQDGMESGEEFTFSGLQTCAGH